MSLLSVSRYVHCNPLAGGLCDRVIDYPWSSYPYYAGLRPVPSWLDLHETIATFRSAKAYCAFVDKNEGDAKSDALAEMLVGDSVPPVLGSPAFVDAIQQRYCDAPDYEIPQAKVPNSAVTLDEIIDAVSVYTGIPRQEIVTAARQRARTVRAMAMLLCRQYGGFGLRDIGSAFGIEQYTTVASAISRCRDKADKNMNLALELDTLKQRILKMRNA